MGAQWKAKGKELAANARGKLFGRLAKDIMVAARSGADPASNARLRLVVEQARKVSMPKETLERAIKKGAGLTGETVHFEHVIYEGFAPHRVAVMVECTTLFVTAPTDLDLVSRALPEHGFKVLTAKLGYKPRNPIDPSSLSAAELEEVEAFLAAIDGNDDVQNVFVALAG